MHTPIVHESYTGKEHWTRKGEVKLFLYEKPATTKEKRGTVLFVHGSSMASQPTFDLQVPGRPYSSVMDYFADQGYDTWCFDMEGYGRSDKLRPINCDIANGADDAAAATDYIMRERGAQRARGNAIDEKRPAVTQLEDVVGCRGEIVGAVRDIAIDVARLVGTTVALHVDAPRVEAARREPLHRRRSGAARELKVERRLRGHRRAVHEQDRAGGRPIGGPLLPQEQAYVALAGPVLLALRRDGGDGFVHD